MDLVPCLFPQTKGNRRKRSGEVTLNEGEDSGQVMLNCSMRNPQDTQAMRVQDMVPLCVVLPLLLVLVDPPIDLHHQSSAVAVEIDDEAADDLLAAEVKAA